MTALMETALPFAGKSVEELLDLVTDTELDNLPVPARTAGEQQAVDAVAQRQAARGLAPAWFARPSEGGGVLIAPNHVDQEAGSALTMEALGITSPNILAGIVEDIAGLARVDGVVSETKLNRSLAFIRAVEPTSELEATMALQMLAIHTATMDYAKRLSSAKAPEARDLYERGLNRLTRTFAAQMTALKQFRTGGQQKVVVQHVHVSDGGQAVVGDVNTGGGGGRKAER